MNFLANPAFEALLQDFLQQAETAFRRRATKAGLNFTGAMLDSFRASAVKTGKDFIVGNVQMEGYVRLKDIKRLHYTHVRPADMLEYFIEKTGLENFAYIPGYEYEGATLPDRQAQIKRIAFAIQAYDRKNPDKKRKYQGIYNDPLGKQIFSRLRQQTTALATKTALEFTINTLEVEL